MIYTISYDLKKPGQNYSKLIDKIKSLGDWAYPCESNWLVDTRLNATQIFEALKPYLDANDQMLITRFNTEDYAGQISSEVIKRWISDKISQKNQYR